MSLLLTECTELSILNEVYYGKPKEFYEIENDLDKICDMCKQITKPTNDQIVDINSSKELARVELALTRYFKVDEVSITFYSTWLFIPDMNMNAFTLPQPLAYFKKDPNDSKRTDPKDLFCNINVDIQLVSSLDLNGKELFAVILHELGHCFDASFFAALSKIPIELIAYGQLEGDKIYGIGVDYEKTIRKILFGFILKLKPASQFMVYANKEINSILSNLPILNTLISNLLKLHVNAKSFVNLYKNITNITNPLYHLNAILPKNIFGYAGEKYADSFASSYGYGLELSSFMNKVNKNKLNIFSEGLEKIPILNIGYDLARVTSKVAFMLCNPHPEDTTRIVSQLNKLKRDLKDPKLDPKVKKELMENISDIEKLINESVLDEKYTIEHGRFMSFIYNWLLIKIFNGKLDPREWMEAVFHHEL